MFSKWDELISFVNNRAAGVQCVVQKYIERPLLYKNRKFDIRIWVACTTKNEIYYYLPGYLRTSSSEYSLEK